MSHARTLVIWNAKAGSTPRAAELFDRFRDEPTVELRTPKDRRDAIRMVRAAVQEGSRLVIAAGGDGTVSSVLNGLCLEQCEATMGVLPLGTGNDLCRTLGIPLDPVDAAELLWPSIGQSAEPSEAAQAKSIDVVEAVSAAETSYFVNAVSGGNAGEVAKHVTSEMKQQWGPWCYVRAAIALVGDLTEYYTELSCDGGPTETFPTWAIVIANGRTVGGGLEIAPQANPQDGLLEAVLVLSSSAIEAAMLTTNYLLGSLLEDDNVVYRQAAEIALRCEPDAKFVADGEPLAGGPLRFKVRPGALRVIAPPQQTS